MEGDNSRLQAHNPPRHGYYLQGASTSLRNLTWPLGSEMLQVMGTGVRVCTSGACHS